MAAQRADARQRRKDILEAAQDIFRTVPEAEITLDAIAKHAGVGIATLYRHFPTRSDLDLACAQDLLVRLDDSARRVSADFEQGPRTQWRDFIWRIVNIGGGTLATVLDPGNIYDLPEPVAKVRDQAIDSVGALMEKAAEEGLVERDLHPLQLSAEIIVVTRPQSAGLYSIDKDVQDRLVERLLLAWEVAAQNQGRG